MPRIPGDDAPSQAALQGDLSCRNGLPVRQRERSVSPELAERRRSITSGGSSLSAQASQTEPVHAPSAPMASAAANCSPVPIPPAASTGTGATAWMISGSSTSVEISPSPVGVNQSANVIVHGSNPCGAVELNFGDGSVVQTYPITQLPAYFAHTWTTTGQKTVTAIGHGNCSGQTSTVVTVQ